MIEHLDTLAARLDPEARISASTTDRALYSRDCWPYLTLQARAGRPSIAPPDAVVFPTSEDDVVACVNWCRENGVPLVPVGGASGVCGSSVPVKGGIALDMKSLVALDTTRSGVGLAEIGAGWNGARLEHELNRRGLTLGHFPSSLGCSTMGGYVATRSAGQLSTRHGKIEDLVLSVRYVDQAGQIRETGLGTSDQTQLIVGSEGTFGVILSTWVRVERAPVHRRYRGYLAPDVPQALSAMRTAMQRGLRPSVLRLYDEFDTYISGARKAGEEKGEPGLVTKLTDFLGGKVDVPHVRGKALAAANGLLGRTLGAPIVMNRVADNVYNGCLLIAGVEEPDAETADAHVADLEDAMSGLKPLGEAPGEHWYEHRMAVSYKMSPLLSAGLFVDTMEVATSWTNLENLYAAVKSGLRNKVFIMAHFSHAYRSGCSIYFTFAGFGATDAACLKRYRETWDAALAIVGEAGGSVTHHHGVGLMKGAALANDHSGGDPLFAALKGEFDPTGFLNPGKLWEVEGQWI